MGAVVDAPAPLVGPPAPVVGPPAPVVDAPAPVVGPPAPVDETAGSTDVPALSVDDASGPGVVAGKLEEDIDSAELDDSIVVSVENEEGATEEVED